MQRTTFQYHDVLIYSLSKDFHNSGIVVGVLEAPNTTLEKPKFRNNSMNNNHSMEETVYRFKPGDKVIFTDHGKLAHGVVTSVSRNGAEFGLVTRTDGAQRICGFKHLLLE